MISFKMKTQKIIYSLTSRGLFSEIFNLLLAIVYAKLNNKKILINTYQWNARINKGWEDYFEPTIKCVNNIFTSQNKIYTNKIWIGNIYYNSKDYLHFYFFYWINRIYTFINTNVELSDKVFTKVRSERYFLEENNEDLVNSMSSALKDIFKLNKNSMFFINDQKKKIALPDDYIGVHIRRGDKIVRKEMNEIDLDRYISEIAKHKGCCRNVYIATDDCSILDYVKQELNNININVFYNSNIKQHGFVEGVFNTKKIEEKYFDTLNTLLDVDILSKSCFFIGTYSSNLSRIIPLMLGFDKCKSLDDNWHVF